MRATEGNFSFKKVLTALPRGEPLDIPTLKNHGLTASHAAHLAKAGWLEHLGRGAYMLPGDTLTRDGCLAYLIRRHPGLHVGSHTALSWRGIRHNITFRETISLWGDKPLSLPTWLQDRFACSYQTTQLFGPALSEGYGIQPLPGGRKDVLVSAPERALLELLSDVGKTATLDVARPLVEGTHHLRTSVLDTLLAHTTRIKVVRLARLLSEELELPWASVAKTHSEKKGGGSLWVAVSRQGERLALKP